jgi:hypothetical protein
MEKVVRKRSDHSSLLVIKKTSRSNSMEECIIPSCKTTEQNREKHGGKQSYTWPLTAAECQAPKGEGQPIKVHPKPCPKCGVKVTNLGPRDKQRARKVLNIKKDEKTGAYPQVVLNPGGAFGEACMRVGDYASTLELPSAREFIDKVEAAINDPVEILSAMVQYGEVLLKDMQSQESQESPAADESQVVDEMEQSKTV